MAKKLEDLESLPPDQEVQEAQEVREDTGPGRMPEIQGSTPQEVYFAAIEQGSTVPQQTEETFEQLGQAIAGIFGPQADPDISVEEQRAKAADQLQNIVDLIDQMNSTAGVELANLAEEVTQRIKAGEVGKETAAEVGLQIGAVSGMIESTRRARDFAVAALGLYQSRAWEKLAAKFQNAHEDLFLLLTGARSYEDWDALAELTGDLIQEADKLQTRAATLLQYARKMRRGRYADLIERAQAIKEKADGARQLVKVQVTPPQKLPSPVDKLNFTAWGLGVGKHLLKVERNGQPLNIAYSLDLDGLADGNVEISRKIDKFDKLVYMAVSALYDRGNPVFTLTDIYKAMGRQGRPGQSDLKKISESVYKMRVAQVSISNEEEARKYNYSKFVYRGALLPSEQVEAEVNGKVVAAAVRVLKTPPLTDFARQRNQIVYIPISVLQVPINLRGQNLEIIDYLLYRINRAKCSPCKILLKTFYEKTNITSRKQQERARATVKVILEHFEKEAFIKNAAITADAITFEF